MAQRHKLLVCYGSGSDYLQRCMGTVTFASRDGGRTQYERSIERRFNRSLAQHRW